MSELNSGQLIFKYVFSNLFQSKRLLKYGTYMESEVSLYPPINDYLIPAKRNTLFLFQSFYFLKTPHCVPH